MQSIATIVSHIMPIPGLRGETSQAIWQSADRARGDLTVLQVAPEKIEEMINDAHKAVVASLALCESPIEETMLACLGHMIVPGIECFPPAIHDVMSGECWPNKPVVIAPQFVIARYRLDFLVAMRAKDYRRLVAIECDGRDYHSLVEDVERDKHRDEYLKSFGIRTLRYTGSWIYKMGHKSADEVPGTLLG